MPVLAIPAIGYGGSLSGAMSKQMGSSYGGDRGVLSGPAQPDTRQVRAHSLNGRLRQTAKPPIHRGSSVAEQWGAVVIIALLGFRLLEMVPVVGKLRPSILLFGISWTIWARAGLSARLKSLMEPPFGYYVAFMVLSLLLVPTSVWPGGSLRTLRFVPFGLTILAAFAKLDGSASTRDRVLWGVILATVPLCVLILLSGEAKVDVVGGARLSTSGSFDPNDLASVGSMLSMLAMGHVLRVGNWAKRLVAVLAFSLCIVVVMKTGSRGGVLAFAAGSVVLVAGMKARHALVLVTALLVAVPVGWKFGPETFRVRTASLLTISEDYTYTSRAGRTQIWQRGLGYFVRNPVFGVGPGNFGTYEGLQNQEQGVGGAWLTAHNTFIQAFVETGLLGGSLIVASLGSALLLAFRSWGQRVARLHPHQYCPELLACVASFVVAAVFLSHAYHFLLPCTLALSRLGNGWNGTRVRSLGGSGLRPQTLRRKS